MNLDCHGAEQQSFVTGESVVVCAHLELRLLLGVLFSTLNRAPRQQMPKVSCTFDLISCW